MKLGENMDLEKKTKGKKKNTIEMNNDLWGDAQ
jgi:hypothetical protein